LLFFIKKPISTDLNIGSGFYFTPLLQSWWWMTTIA